MHGGVVIMDTAKDVTRRSRAMSLESVIYNVKSNKALRSAVMQSGAASIVIDEVRFPPHEVLSLLRNCGNAFRVFLLPFSCL